MASDKWESERQALKKIQYHITLSSNVDKALRVDAAKQEMTPSNLFRHLIGLNHSVMRRPRIGVNLSPDDIMTLAARYNLNPTDDSEIKRRAREEVQLYYREQEKKDS